MNTFLKELKIILIYIFIGIFVGYLSLVLVNFIPKDLIRNNVKISSRILIKQGDMPNMFLKGTTLENFTDADAISLTFNKDNNPFYDALYAYNYQLVKRKAFRGVKALKLTAAENTQKLNIYEHSQEWHGYQTLLRPLLIFYDISDLRYLSFLTVQILLILVCFNITKAFNNRFAFIPFLFGFEYFNYTFESITFLFSMDFCIMLLGCLAILKAVEKKKDYKYIGRIFAILAISDSYFSMFNMPILTIAFPLILWLSLTEYKNHSSISQNNKMVLIFTTYWFSAYTLMTSIKIFITKIFLGLKNGVYVSKYYSGLLDNKTIMDRVDMAVDLFNNAIERNPIGFHILIILLLCLLIYSLFNKKLKRFDIQRSIAYIFIALFPFIWIFCLVLAAKIWWVVTYWCITVYALLQYFWNIAFRKNDE